MPICILVRFRAKETSAIFHCIRCLTCIISNYMIAVIKGETSVYSISPLLRSSDVTLPWSIMWLADISVRTSQKRIRLSKCPEMIVDPAPSDVTRSLHDDPANFVSVPME